MITRRSALCTLLLVGFLATQSVHAQSGWFSGKDSSSNSTAKSSGSSWWPSSWLTTKKKSPTVRSQPSTMSKIGNSTKKAWSNTVDFITDPFDKKSSTGLPPSTGGSSYNKPVTKTETTWWPWGKQPEEKKTLTVREWQSGEMPKF